MTNSTTTPPRGFNPANIRRMMAYNDALTHWLKVGFSYHTACYLAEAKHGYGSAARSTALAYVLRNTSIREEDLT